MHHDNAPRQTNARRRSGGDMISAATRVVWGLIGAVVVITLLLNFYPAWTRLAWMRGDLADKRGKLAELKKQTAEHEQEVKLLQTDPQYLEIIARDKLDLMKDGETIFHLSSNQQHQ